MSLLNQGNEEVVVYPEIVVEDEDGNTLVLPSTEGVPTPAMIRVQAQSGTSARRSEQMDDGFFTEEVYTLRFPRGSAGDRLGRLGSQSAIEWRGQHWAIFGEPLFYNGSRRTRRYQYTIRRN